MTARPDAATVDLQVHSTASDGSVAPGDIARAAQTARLSAFALTDHDSVSGIADATAAANALGIRVVPGVELSAMHANREVHLLGLHIGALAAIAERLALFQAQRSERALQIVARLRTLNVPITFEDVQREAGTGAIGRPHIARAMVAAKLCADFRDAFDRFLGAGRPAYVAKPALSAREAIAMVHDAGGLAIWAHPGSEGRLSRMASLAGEGLDGSEILHPGHAPEDVKRLRALCDHLNLVPSGGSDWHGEITGLRTLGAMHVPAEFLAIQDARVALRRRAGVT